VSDEFASTGEAQERAPITFTRLLHGRIRSPHDIPDQSLSALVEHWSAVRSQTFTAKLGGGELDPEDLFAELAYGVWIAQEGTAGRWCVVADLLRFGAVDSWSQVADVMDVTETEARDGFHAWINGQVDLRRRTSRIGMTDAEAAELYALSAAVSW
jgi:hypothetical protein